MSRAMILPLLISSMLLACSAEGQSVESEKPSVAQRVEPSAGTAEAFVEAINRKDVSALVEMASIPFQYRSQEWVSADDGYGFVLGAAEDQQIGDAGALRKFFEGLVGRVEIENEKISDLLPPGDSLLEEEMSGAPKAWSTLYLGLFLRGSGDVEHLAVVGLSSDSGKVGALYVN